jgi:hypothetical protein
MNREYQGIKVKIAEKQGNFYILEVENNLEKSIPKNFTVRLLQGLNKLGEVNLGEEKADWTEYLKISDSLFYHYYKHKWVKNYWKNEERWNFKDNSLEITEDNRNKEMIWWLWEISKKQGGRQR